MPKGLRYALSAGRGIPCGSVGAGPARAAERRPRIHRLIVSIAEYEREPESCTSTSQDLYDALFPSGREATAFALVAQIRDRGYLRLEWWVLD